MRWILRGLILVGQGHVSGTANEAESLVAMKSYRTDLKLDNAEEDAQQSVTLVLKGQRAPRRWGGYQRLLSIESQILTFTGCLSDCNDGGRCDDPVEHTERFTHRNFLDRRRK